MLKNFCLCRGDPYCDLVSASALKSTRGKLSNLTNKAWSPKIAEKSRIKSKINYRAGSDYLESLTQPSRRTLKKRCVVNEYDTISISPSYTSSSFLNTTANSIHFYHPKSIQKPQSSSFTNSKSNTTSSNKAESLIYSKTSDQSVSCDTGRKIESTKRKLHKPNVYETVSCVKSSSHVYKEPLAVQYQIEENVYDYFELAKCVEGEEAIANVMETGSLSGQEIAYIAQSELDSTGSTSLPSKMSSEENKQTEEKIMRIEIIQDSKENESPKMNGELCCPRCGRPKRKSRSKNQKAINSSNQNIYYDLFKLDENKPSRVLNSK
jgi:hypothetical protein